MRPMRRREWQSGSSRNRCQTDRLHHTCKSQNYTSYRFSQLRVEKPETTKRPKNRSATKTSPIVETTYTESTSSPRGVKTPPEKPGSAARAGRTRGQRWCTAGRICRRSAARRAMKNGGIDSAKHGESDWGRRRSLRKPAEGVL